MSRGQVGVLQHRMNGSTDRGAIPAPLPRRQVEVDRVFVEADVDGEPEQIAAFVGARADVDDVVDGAGASVSCDRGSGIAVAIRWRWSSFGRVPRLTARRRSASHSSTSAHGSSCGSMVSRSRRLGGGLERHRPVAECAVGGEHTGAGPVGPPLRLGLGLVAAMQRHHEVVDGPGARHVQQPPPLGVAHLFVERLERLEDRVVTLGQRPRAVRRPHRAIRRLPDSGWSDRRRS